MSEGAVQLVVEWRSAKVEVSARTTGGERVAASRVAPARGLDAVCAELATEFGASEVVVRAQPGLVVVDRASTAIAVLVGDEPDTSPDAGWLTGRLPGKADDWVAAVGAAPSPHWMLAKLSYAHRAVPDAWSSMAKALTPQAWLVQQLTGVGVTDAADAAATGAWAKGTYRLDLLAIVDSSLEWLSLLPTVASGRELGRWHDLPVVAG